MPRFRHGATRASYFSFRPLSSPQLLSSRRIRGHPSCPFRRARASAGRKTGANITAIATSAAIPRVAIYVTRSRDLVAFALLRAESRGGTGGGGSRGKEDKEQEKEKRRRGEREGTRENRARRGRASGGDDALVLQIGGCCIDWPNFDRQDRGRNRQTKETEREREREKEKGRGQI